MNSGRRLVIAIAVACAALVASTLYRSRALEPIDDLFIPFCGAHALVTGGDPYSLACVATAGKVNASYPLTTILAVLPFTVLGGWWGPIVLWSLVAGLLAWALLARGEVWRLLTLTSAPFLVSFMVLQWAPLILAVAFLPALLPLLLIKPHVGLPVLLTNLTWRRTIGCVGFAAVSLMVSPTWPLRWLAQVGSFDGFVPVLTVLPVGLILLTAALRWRSPRARFFLLMALVPQRGVYDLLPLWFLIETRRQLLVLNGLSWAMLGLVILANQHGLAIEAIKATSLGLVYVPLLVTVLRKDAGTRA
jgi:hypothetical protein